jgi:peptidoglycan/LPS O-acetylase OafA/YrhL
MHSGGEAPPRIDYVDGLRAIAVLTVLVSHVALHAPLTGMPYRILMEGAHGVDLFFVISGFCLAFPTLAKLHAGAPISFDLAGFAAKRLVRIVPPFYMATVVLLALAALPHLLIRHALPAGLPGAYSLVAPLLFLDDRVDLLNGSFWTLMVEFRWYFAFPAMLWLWTRSPRAFVAVGLASFVLYHFTRARGLDFGTLPGFMLGIVAADLHVRGVRTAGWGARLQRWSWALALVGVAAGVAAEGPATIPGFDRADVAFAYQPTILGWQVACFAFVVLAGNSAIARRILSVPALVVTGVASYAIYLVHEPVIALVLAHVHGLLLGGVAAGTTALFAGFAFWAVVERPVTTGKLRAPFLAVTRPLVERVLSLAGIGRTIRIGTPQESIPAPVVQRPIETYASSRMAVAAPSSPT